MNDPCSATVTPPVGLPVVPDAPPWLALHVDPASVPVAYRHTRAILDGDPLADDSLQVVSELVTNAVRHHPSGYISQPGLTPILLSVQVEARWVLVAVRDPWRGMPVEREAADDDLDGRGLRIVRALTAARWVTVHGHGGKTVYALLLREGCTLAPGELWKLRHS